jgi:hypothetical protein
MKPTKERFYVAKVITGPPKIYIQMNPGFVKSKCHITLKLFEGLFPESEFVMVEVHDG